MLVEPYDLINAIEFNLFPFPEGFRLLFLEDDTDFLDIPEFWKAKAAGQPKFILDHIRFVHQKKAIFNDY